MSYTIEQISGAPILVLTAGPDVSNGVMGMNESRPEMLQILADQPAPLFLILDLQTVRMDLDGHLEAASAAALGKSPLLHHPKIRETLFVSNDELMKMSIKGLTSSATFGFAKASLFATVDEALQHCYDQFGWA